MYTVGLIRVLTMRDEEKTNLHGKIIEKAFNELKVISKCIEDQPLGIYDEISEEIAKPKILRLIKEFEAMNVDVVIVSCAADPAVEEGRRTSKIPVIGAGSATASLALSYGERIGVLKITEEVPRVIKRILGRHLVAEEKPEGVRNTVDLMQESGIRASIKALEKLLESGVDVIIPGCTGFSTINFIDIVRKISDKLLFIDPVLASGSVALGILKQLNRRGGKNDCQS
jgi:Asp/Glu/hydantoin racemase